MKKVKKKQTQALAINIIFSLVALLALTVSIAFLLSNYSLKSKLEQSEGLNAELSEKANIYIYSEDDMNKAVEKAYSEAADDKKDELLSHIKELMSEGKSAYYLLRDIFPNDVVVGDKNGYVFFPIDDELIRNDIKLENLIQNEETNEIVYVNDNNDTISKKGIDVSSHNGRIDWAKVKADGVEFAFIRVGYRGSTEGALSLDTTFKYNIENAISNGIDVGVYFYTQAINEEEAVKEAEYVLDAIEPYDISYPVVYDIEEYEGGRADDLSQDQYTANTKAFLRTVENAGYEPMVYANLKGLFIMQDIYELKEYKKWFAYYIYPLYYPYELSIWQYSSTGRVDGIKGDVDLNIKFD